MCAALTSSSFAMAKATALTLDDLGDVVEELYDIRAKWYDFGLRLKVPVGTLDSIKTEYKDPKDQLREMLRIWLKGINPKPTWRALVDALKSRILGEAQLAESLEAKYCKKEAKDPKFLADSALEVKEKQNKLERRFKKLVDMTRKSLNETSVNLSDFRNSITLLPASLKDEHSKFFDEKIPQISRANTLDELFLWLNIYWDYLNYSLLQHIVEEYGNEATNQMMEEYVAEVQAFRRETPLHVFWSIQPNKYHDAPPGFQSLVSTHHGDWSNSTLDDVEKFRLKFAQQYSLRNFTLMLARFERGSLKITWLIPASVKPLLLDEIKENGSRFLKEELVLKLIVDNITIHESETPQQAQESQQESISTDSLSQALLKSPPTSQPIVPLNTLLNVSPETPPKFAPEELRAEEVDQRVQIKAAHMSFRTHFAALAKVINPLDVAAELYSAEVLEDDDLSKILMAQETAKQAHILLSIVSSLVKLDPAVFGTFCDVLSKEAATQKMVQQLKDTCEKHLETEQRKAKRNGAKQFHTEKGEFDKLKEELEVYMNARTRQGASQDALIICVKDCIQNYIESMLKAGIGTDSLKSQMWSLCYQDFFIPTSVYDWALGQIVDIGMRYSALSADSAVSTPPQEDETIPQPLFCKESLYHASLCSHAVSTCNAANFTGFLNHKSNPHLLEEVSMSISQDKKDVDRYLIAKQKDSNIIYIAFQSEANLSEWTKKYGSFDEGLDKQTNRIPLRFFVEQLWDQKRIVLTGFSFGGLLACHVAANIWRNSYISTGILERNVVCITFGQPLLDIPFVHKVMNDFKQFESTIHSIFSKEDLVPRLLRYFGGWCAHRSSNAVRVLLTDSKPALLPALTSTESNKEFQNPLSAKFLHSLAFLQERGQQEESYSRAVSERNSPLRDAKIKALSDLKEALKEAISQTETVCSVLGTCYILHKGGSQATLRNQVPKEIAAHELGFLDEATIEMLEASLFKQHNMVDYRHNALKGKEPIPSAVKEIREVSILRPHIEAVEFHEYPNELAVVLEGDNLWFCHEIRLGESLRSNPINTPAQNVSRRSIQFNFTPSPRVRSDLLASHGQAVKITLHSHFANPIRKKMPVKKEPYSFTQRQMQLAKLTPREIIILAYLTAMLERRPKLQSEPIPSRRFNEVVQFLHEAVKVVPLESICYAIGYSTSNNTVLKCSRALTALSPSSFPPSKTLLNGLQKAAFRNRIGIPPEAIDPLIEMGLRQLTSLFPQLGHGNLPINIDVKALRGGDRLSVTVTPLIPMPSLSKGTLSSVASYADIASSKQSQRITAPKQGIGLKAHPVQAPSCTVNTKLAEVPSKLPPSLDLADKLEQFYQTILTKATKKGAALDVICEVDISKVYPVHDELKRRDPRGLKSPIDTLKAAKQALNTFIEEAQEELQSTKESIQNTQACNERMLELVRDIQEDDLRTCAELLAAFMEQQIQVPP